MHPRIPAYVVDGLVRWAQKASTDPGLAEEIVNEVLRRKVRPGAGGALPASTGKIILTCMLNRKCLRSAGSDGFLESSLGKVENLTDGAASSSAGRMGMAQEAKDAHGL